MTESAPRPAKPRRLADEARDRVRFEEEALELGRPGLPRRTAARRIATGGRGPDAGDLRARVPELAVSTQPGTNLRAWLLRILTNLNIDRAGAQQRTPRPQPLEEGDYFLYNRLESAAPRAEPGRGARRRAALAERRRRRARRGPARVPRRRRARRPRRVLLRGGAQILDVPVGTVMSRLHRGRRILKRELAEEAAEE